MDRKSTLILVASLVVILGWYRLTNYIYPPKLVPKTNTISTAAGTNLAVTNIGSATSNTTVIRPADGPAPAMTNAPAGPEETLVLENAEARYTFSSIGGGIKLIELKKYPQNVGCKKDNKLSTNALASLNTRAPVPVMTVLSGGLGPESGFRLTKTGTTVRAEKQIADGVLFIKEFQLSSNYLVKTSFRYENRSAQAITIPEREIVIGTATPMTHHDEPLTLGVEYYDGKTREKITESWFANRALGCLPGSPRSVYQAGNSNIVWGAVHNRFYTIIGLPADGSAPQFIGRRINLPAPSEAELKANPDSVRNPHGYQTALVYPAFSVPTQQVFEQKIELFAGPKEYKTLAKLPKDMDLAMGFGRFFGMFAKALLLSMNWISSKGIPYGFAIIMITVVIKLLFWPLTNASTKSMKRMSALQPQMKAIQEKYKDDPRKMNMKLMEYMKEHKVNPVGGCLPILLQIPVFIGFYQMLQSAIELRGASFLWACDLSEPDTILTLAGFNLNPLPILMGATMLWQSSMTPVSPGVDPMQQKMMKFMPLIMVPILYNYAAGLTLYWTVQNLLSIAQMKITKAKPEEPKPGPGPVAAPVRPKKK
jgi:YidC/Oxa1 family membrane protein insertase